MNGTQWLRIGAVIGALGVILGAFGAHGLRPSREALRAMSPPDREATERRLDTFETGVRYHMYHALAILAVGLVAGRGRRANAALDLAGGLFAAGVALFSGPLYGIGFGGPPILGAVAPLGGVAMILGWFALAAGAGGVSRIEEPHAETRGDGSGWMAQGRPGDEP